MRRMQKYALVLAFLCGTAISSTAMAGGLLGGVLGGSDSGGGLLSVESGPAKTDSVVNLGVGGGGGNIVDLNVGGSSTPVVKANVSSGGSPGKVLGVDADVGSGTVTANVGVGSTNGGGAGVGVDLGVGNGLVDTSVDVGLGTGIGVDVGIGIGTPVTGGGPGTGGPGTGGPGTGGPGTGGPGNGGQGVIPPGPGFGNTGGGSDGSSCVGEDGRTLMRLAQRGGYSQRAVAQWQRATGVQIMPIQVCPEVKAAVASRLGYGPLQDAVSADALISTSLSRSNYDPEDVLAVVRKGSVLQVFVY